MCVRVRQAYVSTSKTELESRGLLDNLWEPLISCLFIALHMTFELLVWETLPTAASDFRKPVHRSNGPWSLLCSDQNTYREDLVVESPKKMPPLVTCIQEHALLSHVVKARFAFLFLRSRSQGSGFTDARSSARSSAVDLGGSFHDLRAHWYSDSVEFWALYGL